MTSGPISGTPSGQLFSRSSHPSTPALRDIQEKNLGGVSSGHAIPQLHPENSQPQTETLVPRSFMGLHGRLIFIHLQCWEVLPLLIIQRQQWIKFRVPRAQDFYTPLALNC